MIPQARNLTINKRPRSGPIPDNPVDFPPLDNLHLELLEVKRKIRQGLPLVPIKKRNPPRPPSKLKEEYSEKENPSKTKESNSEKETPPKEEIKSSEDKKEKVSSEDEKLLEELGDNDHKDSNKENETKDTSPEITPSIEQEEEQEEEEYDDPYAGLSPEEREAKEREEYIWRFRILKKQYKTPQVSIPQYNEHSDLPEMKRAYDRTIRELYLDDAVETYRTYLMGGFIVMEFVCIQWVGVDLSGFTIQQTRMMYKYDRLLIELGEKSYSQWGTGLPIEMRIIGFILLQAGIFYLGKIISVKFGNTVAELFRGMTGMPPQSSGVETSQETPKKTNNIEKPKKRMRGPKIKPDDIRNMSHVQEDMD